MKANVEMLEPVVRPVAATPAPVRLVRSVRRATGFVPGRSTPALFHAWRA